MKVLVIDDEPFALSLLARQLVGLGAREVLTCERAEDALGLIGTDPSAVDVLFCDLNMPELDGVELVRRLAQLEYAGSLVLVSGEDERVLQTAERLARGHGLHVLGAVHKPVSPERLRALLVHAKSGRAPALRAVRKTYGAFDLQRAIREGQLVNHYQPKVELATGAVVGVETLVRWRHPQDGLVFPDQFITTAEEHGLIDELTRAVLAAALGQARRWHDAGLALQVAVNVSMDNLTDLAFPDFVVREVGKAGVPVAGLVLEVTESRLMKDPLAPMDILTRLRLKRIGLSIDDFGTGHSSLAQLRDLPFDELKVDRGFVHGAGRDVSLRAIFEASLGLARQLGMRTVAEGVEDRQDWDFLRAAGCDLAQGWFIAKPMPADALSQWIAGWERRRGELTGDAFQSG
jgi:EAL domain-containing protein (putative c-di-GMP-specific phosphodiesterase class I)/AmiR/NasT family two-component response regulator